MRTTLDLDEDLIRLLREQADDTGRTIGEIATSAKTTDTSLLALAIAHGGKLATFDRKIPAHLLSGGPEALELISRR